MRSPVSAASVELSLSSTFVCLSVMEQGLHGENSFGSCVCLRFWAWFQQKYSIILLKCFLALIVVFIKGTWRFEGHFFQWGTAAGWMWPGVHHHLLEWECKILVTRSSITLNFIGIFFKKLSNWCSQFIVNQLTHRLCVPFTFSKKENICSICWSRTSLLAWDMLGTKQPKTRREGVICCTSLSESLKKASYRRVLSSAGIGLISQETCWANPKQPVKWDIWYHVTSCLIFKWGCWLEQDDLLRRSKLSIGWWESCTLYILFISIVVIFFSLCHSVKLFLSQPSHFTFSFYSSPHPTGARRGVREQLHGSLLPAGAKPQQVGS